MKKLLITAAVLAASVAASGAGAGAAGASTATQLCVAGYNTCYIYGSPIKALDYRDPLIIHINGTITSTLEVKDWTSATSATTGTYTVKSEAGIQVSDITLGAPAGSPSHYTCLSFKENATETVYLVDPISTGLDNWKEGNCSID